MYHFSAENLTQKQNYKFLTGTVIPRPIAWITTENENGSTNLAPFSFFNVVASKIPLVMIAINRKGPQQKDSARNLQRTGEGVIHIVSRNLLQDMNETAANLPAEDSEIPLTSQHLIDSRTVHVKSLADPLIRMEVTSHQYVPIQLDDQTITDLFILKISDYFFHDTVFDPEKEYLLPEKIDPVARLAGNNYAHISDFTALKRPD